MLVLARLHAHWWNHPRLTSDLSEAAKERNWGDRLLMAADSLPQFFEFIADRLSKSRVEILNKVSIQFTHLISERTSNRPITLNHSDSHAWNFLFPKDPHKNSTVLYDWHSWDIGSGTNDLAYFMGLHWYPEKRRRFEIELLRIYFDKLINLGVKGYNWEDCQLDYRLSMLRTMLIPIWQWAEGIPEMIWWSHLDRSFIAFEDLKLGELID